MKSALLIVHRLTVILALAGAILVYALFAFTAVWSREWPHRPGDHRFSSCTKAESFFDPGEWCGGTFDPKGYFGLYLLANVLLVAAPFAAALWLPASLALKLKTNERQLEWNVALAMGVVVIAITVAFDPIGAVAWYVD